PAQWRPYHPAYCPFVWRGWWDFGTGALGDMGAHLIDQPFWALKLGAPKRVQASSTKYTKDSYPLAEIVTYEFPEREGMPPVKLTWYDGGLMPARPKELPAWVMKAAVACLSATRECLFAALTEKIHGSCPMN
ncbi:MAG: hypothetical protein C0168_03915, partial [Candidatus Aminicenantes bacterium]